MRKEPISAAPHSCGLPHSDSVSVLGLPVCAERRSACEKHLSALLRGAGAQPALIFTPNAEILAAAKKDPACKALLSEADLLLPDGIGVLLLSRFRISERLPGIEMGEFLLAETERQSASVYLLGGKPGIAERAADRLKHRFLALRIVGTHHGYFPEGGSEEEALLKDLAALAPDLLMVCMGFPRQERFLLKAKRALPSLCVGIGLGGSLDCWAGTVPRAPRVFRSVGLEWLWRILREPKRIPRLLRSVGNLMMKP